MPVPRCSGGRVSHSSEHFCFLSQGVMCRTLQGHAHWVNTLALSTDYVLRTGAFEPATATVNPQDVTGSRECVELGSQTPA